MLPDGPNMLESQKSLPALALAQTRLMCLPSSAFTSIKDNLIESNQMLIEKIYPGVYFSKLISFWTTERLRSHGITHVINIDRHIQQRFEQITEKDCLVSISKAERLSPQTLNAVVTIPQVVSAEKSLHLYETMKFNRSINGCDTLDLNFGEEPFLTTVLPNCYKAVKFIDKALQNGGSILVIDQFNDQKCLTILIGYLMYKNNINFSDAFHRLKGVFKKAELEPFFINQLYEYEPILQVERARLHGNSCSRELRSAQMKRKKLHDDSLFHSHNDFNYTTQHFMAATNNSAHIHSAGMYGDNSSDVAME